MDIVDARWGYKVNILIIKCDCGYQFEHPANRNKVVCPKCHKVNYAMDIKKE